MLRGEKKVIRGEKEGGGKCPLSASDPISFFPPGFAHRRKKGKRGVFEKERKRGGKEKERKSNRRECPVRF